MDKIKNWLITKLLSKDKLVAVPENWQKDYVKMAADKVKNSAAIATIINEYNSLLKDYYEECSLKKLIGLMEENGLPYKTTLSKKDMINSLYEEFKMTYEK